MPCVNVCLPLFSRSIVENRVRVHRWEIRLVWQGSELTIVGFVGDGLRGDLTSLLPIG